VALQEAKIHFRIHSSDITAFKEMAAFKEKGNYYSMVITVG